VVQQASTHKGIRRSAGATAWLHAGQSLSLTVGALLLSSGLVLADGEGLAWGSYSGGIGAPGLSRVVAGEVPTVRDRYDGLGYRAGQFWILPTLEIGILLDDNVLASASGATEDGAFYVTPNVAMKSDFGRHTLNVEFQANHYEYFDIGSQSRTDFNGAVDGEIDVRHDMVVRGGFRGGLYQQTLANLEYPQVGGITAPGDYWKFGTWTEVEKQFTSIVVSARAGYDLQSYDPVQGIDQSFRDGDEFSVGGRVGGYLTSRARAFGDFEYNWRNYDGAVIPDSQGWRALAGVEMEITRLVAGEVSVGYMEQNYDQFAGPSTTTSGWTYHAGLVWNPTPLMTVNLDADRTIEDSTLDTEGRIQDAVKLSLDYEIRRNLLFTPWVGLAVNDYESQPIDDQRYDFGATVDYKMNRFLSLGVRYLYTYNNVDSAGMSDWDRHFVGLYAKARF
jgi:hypothetical protein